MGTCCDVKEAFVWLLRDHQLLEISDGTIYTYTGREYDTESGLYYYRARYYSSITGRFMQRDPLGTVDGTNLYLYTRGDPVNWADPSGTKRYYNIWIPCGWRKWLHFDRTRMVNQLESRVPAIVGTGAALTCVSGILKWCWYWLVAAIKGWGVVGFLVCSTGWCGVVIAHLGAALVSSTVCMRR